MSKKIKIWHEDKGIDSFLESYLIDTDKPCPAVMICPGGAYEIICSPSEGRPVAEKFNELGMHAFVLTYRVAPDTFPAPQQDAMRALKIIRANADKWKIAPQSIGVCGFSAGGHLAASLGTTLVENIDASAGDCFDRYSARPDFIITGQGVLAATPATDIFTLECLLGHPPTAEEKEKFSPCNCVNENTPPAFIWHTASDQMIDYNCSILFARALIKHNIPCELHIFPRGRHGVLLGLDTPDVSKWHELARKFIAVQTGEEIIPDENYTHLYQCNASHSYPGAVRKENE